MEEIIRDLKKFTATQICKAIESNPQESRREWMLELFREYALESGKHHNYRFLQGEFHPIELNTNKMMDERLLWGHHTDPVMMFILVTKAALTMSLIVKAEPFIFTTLCLYLQLSDRSSSCNSS